MPLMPYLASRVAASAEVRPVLWLVPSWARASLALIAANASPSGIGRSQTSADLHRLLELPGNEMPLVISFLLESGSMVLAPDRFEIDLRGGDLEVHVVQGVCDYLRNDQVAEPLPVGGNDVPGRFLGAGQPQCVLECLGIVVPQFALGIVAFADLPIPLRIIEPGSEALQLFLRADMEEELDDFHAVFAEQFLELPDPGVALAPYRLGHKLVDPDHQHVLVMRPVENRDLPLGRFMQVNAPKEVMGKLDGRRLLEIGDLYTLWIDAGEDVPDRAVLARCIQSLQHDKERALAFSIEFVLKRPQPREMALRLRCCNIIVLVFAGIGRIEA